MVAPHCYICWVLIKNTVNILNKSKTTKHLPKQLGSLLQATYGNNTNIRMLHHGRSRLSGVTKNT